MKKNLMMLYLTTLLIALSYGFTYLLPLWIEQLGGSASDSGLVLSTAGVGCLLLVWFSGDLVNRFGAKNIALCGVGCCLSGFIILSMVYSIGVYIYIGSILVNMGWGLAYAILPMLMMKQLHHTEHGKSFARLTAFIVLGAGSGPILGKILLVYGFTFHQAFLFAVICNILALLILHCMPVTKLPVSTGTTIINAPNECTMLNRKNYFVMLMIFIGACVFGSLMNFQTLYAKTQQFDYANFYFTYLFATISARFACTKLLSYSKPIQPVPYLLVLMTIGILGFLLNQQSSSLYIFTTLLVAIGYGLSYPLLITYAVSITPDHLRNKMLAYVAFAYFLGICVFSLLSGNLINHAGIAFWLKLLIVLSLFESAIAWWVSLKFRD